MPEGIGEACVPSDGGGGCITVPGAGEEGGGGGSVGKWVAVGGEACPTLSTAIGVGGEACPVPCATICAYVGGEACPEAAPPTLL